MGQMELVLRELGIKYSISGDEAIARCPAHEDHHPSWSMNLKNGAHHCFACGFSGNLAHLVQHVLGLSYYQASEWLNGKVGWLKAYEWYQVTKENTNYSPAYLKISEASLAPFTFPPEEELAKKKISAEAAAEYGVMWNPDKSSWIFPIRDPYNNDLWGWQEKGTLDRRFRNYPHGVRKSETLFGLSSFEYDSTAYLVESPIDCVRLCTAGIRGGLSSFGVHVSDRQLSLVHQCARKIVLALDNDSAGVAETDRICRDFDGIPVYVWEYAHVNAKDPGEMEDIDIRMGAANAESKLRRRARGNHKGI